MNQCSLLRKGNNLYELLVISYKLLVISPEPAERVPILRIPTPKLQAISYQLLAFKNATHLEHKLLAISL